jgi:predicted LPLAT superfamily acyltransferase
MDDRQGSASGVPGHPGGRPTALTFLYLTKYSNRNATNDWFRRMQNETHGYKFGNLFTHCLEFTSITGHECLEEE